MERGDALLPSSLEADDLKYFRTERRFLTSARWFRAVCCYRRRTDDDKRCDDNRYAGTRQCRILQSPPVMAQNLLERMAKVKVES
jgi:hypothetical protein